MLDKLTCLTHKDSSGKFITTVPALPGFQVEGKLIRRRRSKKAEYQPIFPSILMDRVADKIKSMREEGVENFFNEEMEHACRKRAYLFLKTAVEKYTIPVDYLLAKSNPLYIDTVDMIVLGIRNNVDLIPNKEDVAIIPGTIFRIKPEIITSNKKCFWLRSEIERIINLVLSNQD